MIFTSRKHAERLMEESRDRLLSPSEQRIVARYPDVQSKLERANMALDLLRDSSMEPVTNGLEFERRIVRRLRNQRTSDGLKYWSPALIGAAVAAVALVAALQIVTRANELPALNRPMAEARNQVKAVPLDLPKSNLLR
jgi:anti-sigma-K factor RskA